MDYTVTQFYTNAPHTPIIPAVSPLYRVSDTHSPQGITLFELDKAVYSVKLSSKD